ncbi:DUF3466 family protein [Vibrio sp. JPW-9-11-11]|uniref:DUF3466 family protein n=1 Tax=Vibrio sp. JPW-9-11-11 TaxID=1416532 RepID=UPI001594C70F|nr:DUF3466 family protein [Vibrio sp. JPW-9-11-11]NVD06639.1 DUF3466 family protein [Vibrio sp. JPW-9-11-11]
MSRNSLRITTLAATVAASFGVNAALYNVYMSAPEGASSSLQTYGVAVSDETMNCWSASCGASTSELAVEVKRYREGFQYRDEAPFFLPFGWTYLDDGYDGFRSYCRNFLGYQTTQCDIWADAQYTSGYKNEVDGNYAGSIAYLNGGSELFAENTVVNSINSAGQPVGNTRNGGSNRNLGYIDTTLDTVSGSDFLSSQYWVSKSLSGSVYTVGSVSRNNVDTGNSKTYTSKPTVWKDGTANELNWQGNRSENGDAKAQGSIRDIVETSALYAVGYSSDSDVRLKAAVFKSTDSGTSWTTTLVSNFPYDSSEYANQTLKSVNDNGIAIGTAKLNRALNGAYANTLFYVSDLETPSYKAFSGDIFFTGANGKAGAINNHDEVVGTIDYERHSETNGNPRAKRAFIAPLSSKAQAPLNSKAWYLDDLTYGSGASTNNNQYRIIEAADINDAGVIAATAYYCASGWDSEAINASCNAGASLVAVELVPIQGATSITARPVEQETVERKGGTLGLFVLSLLGLFGFRRK